MNILQNIYKKLPPYWGGLGVGLLLALPTFAQEDYKHTYLDDLVVTGSIQSDILIPQDDEAIGTESVDEWGLTNTYVDINAQSKHIDAGARFEFKRFPLPGYEKGYTPKSSNFAGWGVPFAYLKAKWDSGDVTLGSFYEQFGSGFILRTYEERALGIDNSLIGARVNLRPAKGVAVKALTGTQRLNWTTTGSWMTGADVELAVDQWIPAMEQSNTRLTLGGSALNKYEKADEDIASSLFAYYYNVPSNVGSWDARVNFQKGGLSVLAEYAQKSQDPSADNGYIYRPGRVAMLSASYSNKGFSLLGQAKRSDNMSNRSIRKRLGTAAFLNHLPAFTQDQTYALAALYPYATNRMGEWAYQGQLNYKFKRKTALGGKYGTSISVNYSYVTGIDRHNRPAAAEITTADHPFYAFTDGYGSAFFKTNGETYYQDINVTLDKKLTKDFTLKAMYMNQIYNKTVVEGEGGTIHSNIFVLDGKYKFSPKTTLRMEAQYLNTKDDQGDWLYGLAELSVLPHFMFTISDMYNAGDTKYHYYLGGVTYNTGSHRLMLSYGRTRAGFNCSGGVCRWIPATKGVNISYNYNF